MNRLVDVYPYRKEEESVKFLVLKRSPNVIYAGEWRMIGGKVEDDEQAYEAALRELKEETGLEPALFWTLPSVNQFYDPQVDRVRHIPAFAAEVDASDELILNHEHIDFQWIEESEINSYLNWPEQQRLMHLLHSIITHNQLTEAWIIEH